MTVRDLQTIQNNISTRLREIKEQHKLSLQALERVSGLDDSTISKVLKLKGNGGVERQIQLRYVEDLVHGINRLLKLDPASRDALTLDDVILKYNNIADIKRLPKKLGFTRFLARRDIGPVRATAEDVEDIHDIVSGKSEKELVIEAKVIISYEPMGSNSFTKGTRYVIRLGNEHECVASYPFSDEYDDFVVIGRVTDVKLA